MDAIRQDRYELRPPRTHVGLILGLLLFSGPVCAATYYVDGNCPTSGNATTTVCGSNGPKKTLEEALPLLGTPGTLIRVRGIHPPHDGETTTFDGRYFQNEYAITGACTQTSPCIIENYGWTAVGTGETVFLDGTRPSSEGWTQCTNCTTGVCAGVPGVCNETWYTSDNGTAPSGFQSGSAAEVRFAQNRFGTVTYRVANISDLTNAHATFNPKRCSSAKWRPCGIDSDCPTGDTCSFVVPEIDSFRDGSVSPNRLFVRWGAGADAPVTGNKPYVSYTNIGDAFAFKDNTAYITIRGFTIRAHKNASIYIDRFSTNNISLIDLKMFFSQCGLDCDGINRAIAHSEATNVTIANCEMAHMADEGIHARGRHDDSPTVLSVRNNWIHHAGSETVIGANRGSPSGILIGDDRDHAGTNNWSGTVIEGNLIEHLSRSAGYGAYGIRLENSADNLIVRNNIVRDTTEPMLVIAGTPGMAGTAWSTNNNEIYNNILTGGSSHGIDIWCTAPATVQDNKIYNNTVVGAGTLSRELNVSIATGTFTRNIVRNNIFMSTAAKQVVEWSGGATFRDNIIYSPSGGTLVNYNGRSLACTGLVDSADVDGDGEGSDNDRCVQPQFVSTNGTDFHLNGSSPAIDKGSDFSGRTQSIYNSLAGVHGLPVYSDGLRDGLPKKGSAWDIGAIEYPIGGPPTASVDLGGLSLVPAGAIALKLNTSVAVVQLPGPLTFTESDGTTTLITLSGAVPGNVFTGTFLVDGSVADGTGNFSLPPSNLVDALGNKGNTVSSGQQANINATPPAAPTNLRVGS